MRLMRIYPFKSNKKTIKYIKPKPIIDKEYKFSNKKHNNNHSGQRCTVLNVANDTNHNVLVKCEDGYLVITSKWNLFDI
jgi:hypothetical protein